MAMSDELARLGDLHQRGVLSDDEFARAKARVLDGGSAASSGVAAINSLRRSVADRWLGGVCGGLGEFTGVSAWVWRLCFALMVLCAGTGMLAYVLLWIFVPSQAAARPLPALGSR
ncbi:PspC domain-containing protein [Aquabacterium sp.]|uniref:PspC domain-containing protein n=1 Tax=Aquabacterium sp. TaxID=1872578 RepID=UPI0037833288